MTCIEDLYSYSLYFRGQYNSIFDPRWDWTGKYILGFKYTFCVIVNLNKFIVYVYYTSGMRTAFGVLFVAETV